METTETTHDLVRAYYADRALTRSSCCGPAAAAVDADRLAAAVGYSEEEIALGSGGANLGLGCGNPTAIESIPRGATVLDLGSGAGFDCFLAAQQVGEEGHVIGVDMTPEMIERARANAAGLGLTNVEFRMGLIEDLPLEDQSVDVVISNCVINLSPEKPRVFAEAFRVLKSGGRLMVSDLVLSHTLPETLRKDVEAYVGCVAGAELKERYLSMIAEAGFKDVRVQGEDDYLANTGCCDYQGVIADGSVISLKVLAVRE